MGNVLSLHASGAASRAIGPARWACPFAAVSPIFLVVNLLGGLGRREAAGFNSAGIQRGAIWSLGMETQRQAGRNLEALNVEPTFAV
jgi:hypothetical protein